MEIYTFHNTTFVRSLCSLTQFVKDKENLKDDDCKRQKFLKLSQLSFAIAAKHFYESVKSAFYTFALNQKNILCSRNLWFRLEHLASVL